MDMFSASPAVIPGPGVGLVMRSSSIRRLLSLLFAVLKKRSSYAAIALSEGEVPCAPPFPKLSRDAMIGGCDPREVGSRVGANPQP